MKNNEKGPTKNKKNKKERKMAVCQTRLYLCVRSTLNSQPFPRAPITRFSVKPMHYSASLNIAIICTTAGAWLGKSSIMNMSSFLTLMRSSGVISCFLGPNFPSSVSLPKIGVSLGPQSEAHRAAVSKAMTGVPRSKAARAAISKGLSKYKIPWNQRTHPAEYKRAYRAAKEAERS